MIIKNHFHINGFALSLALKVRLFGTRKWPINFCTGLFLRGGFINNRKTSSGAILSTDILYSLFKY